MTRRTVLLILALVLLVTLVAVHWIHRKSGPKANNILLISIDTCRADYLGCYGAKYDATVNIDLFAEQSVLFDFAVTPVPLTLPSHSSMLTGMYPINHGVHGNLDYKLDAEYITLAEILKNDGYHTGAIVSGYVLDSTFGLDQGFDEYDDNFENVIRPTYLTERRAGETTDRALEWLQKNKHRPWFLFLHYYDPHWRYEPPEPFRSKFSTNLYAGEIAYVDHCIGKVFDKLKELGVYDSSFIILTGDHGEMLGEHGEADHGYFIYNSALHVPLILKTPGNTKPQRVQSLVSLVDIVPTVCRFAGVEPPEGISGQSLLSDLAKSESERYLYCESYVPAKHGANVLLGLVTGKYKYIQTTHPELYDLESDWQEQKNLCQTEPKRAHFLREHLREIVQTAKKDGYKNIELSDEQRAKLESLGYIGSVNVEASVAFDTDKPDPKEFIKFHNIKAYNDMAIELVNSGKLKEGIEAFKALISHYEKAEIEHSMTKVYYNLGVALDKNGENEEAKKYYEMALDEVNQEIESNTDPYYESELYGLLGDICASMSDFEQASAAFRKSIELNPDDPQQYYNLVMSLRFQDKSPDSQAVLDDAIKYFEDKGDKQAAERLSKLRTQEETEDNQDEQSSSTQRPGIVK